MATFDYSEVIAVADELTAEFGREITFVSDDETPADANKPWDGGGATDNTVTLNAVFVPPNTVRQFGVTALGQGTEFVDLLQFSEQIAIVYQGSEDLRDYDYINDPGFGRWKIVGIQVLRPGDDNVLAFVAVRR